MGRQTELLELQEIDSRIDKLVKQRESIPERAEADGLGEEIGKIESVLSQLADHLHDAEREQARLENSEQTLTDKIRREEKKLYGGSVVNPKELGSIQEEVASLKRKRDDLETTLLEAMESVEQRRVKVVEVTSRKEGTEARLRDAEQAYAAKAADLDEQIASEGRSRTEAATRIAEDMLAAYEKVRRQKGGVAVGEMRDGVCGACRVELPSQEVDRMRGSDSLWRCPQCRRILVERS